MLQGLTVSTAIHRTRTNATHLEKEQMNDRVSTTHSQNELRGFGIQVSAAKWPKFAWSGVGFTAHSIFFFFFNNTGSFVYVTEQDGLLHIKEYNEYRKE